jgi:hypothetical protein
MSTRSSSDAAACDQQQAWLSLCLGTMLRHPRGQVAAAAQCINRHLRQSLLAQHLKLSACWFIVEPGTWSLSCNSPIHIQHQVDQPVCLLACPPAPLPPQPPCLSLIAVLPVCLPASTPLHCCISHPCFPPSSHPPAPSLYLSPLALCSALNQPTRPCPLPRPRPTLAACAAQEQ